MIINMQHTYMNYFFSLLSLTVMHGIDILVHSYKWIDMLHNSVVLQVHVYVTLITEYMMQRLPFNMSLFLNTSPFSPNQIFTVEAF